MRFFKSLIVCFLTLLFFSAPFHLIAQNSENCPAFVKQAITLTNNSCQAVGRNQACYGNLTLTAEPRSNVTSFTFSEPGDIVSIDDISSLKLGPMNLDQRIWGVSLMKLQANIPDTLPGQNVSVLLFGDVELRPNVLTNLTVVVREGTPINVRHGPSKTASIVGMLLGGAQVTADGRDGSNTWLHVKLSDGSVGWLSRSLVTFEGDLSSLENMSGDSGASGRLQAFYLHTGVNDTGCSEAPASGIIVQTPQGVKQIELRMNEVDIQLGSTAYMQANADAGLEIFTLEGKANVTAKGVLQSVTTGNRTSVPLNENLAAVQAPIKPTTYSVKEVSGLAAPLSILAHGNFNNFEVPNCTPVNGPLLTDQYINVVSGTGCWHTFDQAQAAFEGHTAVLTIDGTQVTPEIRPVHPTDCAGSTGNEYTGDISYHWVAAPGTHTVHLTWSGPVSNQDYACTVAVFG